jgi:type I restriction enzyme R subunit
MAAMTERMAELPMNVAIVAAEKAWIEKAASRAFWPAATEAQLDELLQHLGPLMHYRQPIRHGGITVLNLQDKLLLKETVEFGPEHERLSTARYRELAETAIRQLADEHPVLQQIKTGQPVSEADMQNLANQLAAQSPYITPALLQQAYDNRHASFLRLLRHVLGLEVLPSFTRQVSDAFNQFIATHNNYSALQLRFIELIKEFILDKGAIEPADLVSMPFTQLHSHGIAGLFTQQQAREILQFTRKITA